MTGWCNNSITISGNKEQIDKLETFLNKKNGKEWFNFFLPCPEELKNEKSPNKTKNAQVLTKKYGFGDWYSWSVANWSTKWNADAQDWNRDENSISFWFDSVWAPPTALYDKITAEGYDVEAYYLEESMCFVGKYSKGTDEYYEYTNSKSLNDIPDDIVDNWNLRDNLKEDEMNEEEKND